MNNQELIGQLNLFRDRLLEDVFSAYEERGATFGRERFTSWRSQFVRFLSAHLPSQVSVFDNKLKNFVIVGIRGESDAHHFWRTQGEKALCCIESLILDIENDEYDFSISEDKPSDTIPSSRAERDLKSVFIVHGRDDAAKHQIARVVEKLGLNAIILHEQANSGRTIIEKIEKYSNVGFAIILYTPDDLGNGKNEFDESKGELNSRARQNVVFEHGYLMAKIGRENVAHLVEGDIELPNDISGTVYISEKGWELKIIKELKEAGYAIDSDKLL